MESAAQENNQELMAMLLQTYHTFSFEWLGLHLALNNAICHGSEEMVELLLASPELKLFSTVDMGYKRSTVCHWAYRSRSYSDRNPNIIDFYAELPATSELKHICKSGRSLLACAIWGNNTTMSEHLLADDRIDVNAGAAKMTPIWEAVRRGRTQAVRKLLDSNELEWEAGERVALIELAAYSGNQVITDILISLPEYANMGRRKNTASVRAVQIFR